MAQSADREKKEPACASHQTAGPPGLRTVLVARFSAFGDVAMTIPAVYSACRCYPGVRFVMLTRPSMTSMFVGAPENLTVVGADLKEKYAGIGGIRRLCADMVARFRPDAFVDLHNVLRTKLMAFFLKLDGIPASRLYKPRSRRRALTRAHNKVMLPLVSQRARYSEAFFKAGFPLNERFGGLFGAPGKAPSAAYAAISEPKGTGEKWAGIAPYAAHAGKIYPPEMMERVVAAVSGRGDTRIFLFGGAAESEVLDGWARKYPGVTSLAGKRYGFSAELALMNHLDLMLSMDSANMHLAAIAGTRTLSVWGATHPYCGFMPWRHNEADIIQLPLGCRPCSVFGDKPCARGDYQCLRGIEPRTIIDKINGILSSGSGKSADSEL